MTFASGLASMAMANGLMCLGGMVLLAMLITITVGTILISSEKTQRTRRIGLGILLFGLSIPFLCCLGLTNFNDRSHLRKTIQEGMTEAEVLAILGKPDSVQQNLWIYHGRSVLDPYGVRFDENGRVLWTFSE